MKHQPRCFGAQAVLGLMKGRERRLCVGGDIHIVEPSHRAISGNSQAHLLQAPQQAKGHHVVEAHDGRRGLRELHEMLRGPVALFRAAARLMVQIALQRREPGRLDLGLVAVRAVPLRATGSRVAEIGDTAVAEIHEVPRNLRCPKAVIVVDRELIILSVLVVDHGEREAVFPEAATMLRQEGRGTEDHAIHPALEHRPHDGSLAVGVLARGSHKEAVALWLERIFDPFQHTAEEGIVEIIQDDPQCLGSPIHEATRHSAGEVTHLGGDDPNALHRFR